jgi:hypothetical protein
MLNLIYIAGVWDMWLSPEQEYSIQWRFLLKHFDVSTLFMTPIKGVQGEGLIEASSLTEVLESNSHLTPVVVDENSPNQLRDFEHPHGETLYIFGRVGYSPLESLNWGGHSTRIEASSNKHSPFLHPNQAAAIVLYDRLVKSWQ